MNACHDISFTLSSSYVDVYGAMKKKKKRLSGFPYAIVGFLRRPEVPKKLSNLNIKLCIS